MDTNILSFLDSYPATVATRARQLRDTLLEMLPGIIEQLDVPAKMIAYTYGQKYTQMICTLIPSQKGLKLGFYKGNELPDPAGILKGNGKISRYVEVKDDETLHSAALKKLVGAALQAYRERI
ncbi:DUF1801 domain-containing protein [Chitinophaga varians]|uniref:DUF1801 domain-containing protein n=1 Tax=Chitinophaga varians TaxID=2202339 RepID=UPI00165FC9F6|nr:DUF1801 domain-containing protein [Chitinophaga varians]MBC9913034.1 DUF1801 domain-containing protein [Chitinophaga varians]